MMYKIDVRRLAQRRLDKLPESEFQAVIKAIKELALTPRPKGIEKVKTTGLWRIRQGDYRIVFAIDDKEHNIQVTLMSRLSWRAIRVVYPDINRDMKV